MIKEFINDVVGCYILTSNYFIDDKTVHIPHRGFFDITSKLSVLDDLVNSNIPFGLVSNTINRFGRLEDTNILFFDGNELKRFHLDFDVEWKSGCDDPTVTFIEYTLTNVDHEKLKMYNVMKSV